MVPVDALAPGMYLGHRYRLVDRLGQGGMASVWSAVDQVLGRPVAVKALSPWLIADGDFLERFRVEARAAAQLSHPHITSVFDYGEWVLPGGERVAFIVMELLDGESLAARLQRGPLPWPQAAAVCAQVAQALAAAHRRGVVHRDVKPGNVVLTEAGAKVLDFGIAAMAGEEALTSSGGMRGVFGTAAYVAPELLAGELVTPGADVYGLGVLLFESLTGRLPLSGEAEPAVQGLPAEVALLPGRCLARRPDERPSSAEVAKRLQAALGAGSWQGAASPSTAASASDTVLLPALDVDDPATRALAGAARPSWRQRLLVGALWAAALAVVIVTVLMLRPGERSATPASTAGSPASTSTTPAAVTSASSSTAEPPPSQPLDALERLRRSIDEGVASGEIRADVGNDFDNLIGDMRERLADGRLGGVNHRIDEFRHKLEDRVQEGDISATRAQVVSQALDALAQTLPTG
jgi:eukaryotic-like serine/threonine-protein kinase